VAYLHFVLLLLPPHIPFLPLAIPPHLSLPLPSPLTNLRDLGAREQMKGAREQKINKYISIGLVLISVLLAA
jgi:hypothetical protein